LPKMHGEALALAVLLLCLLHPSAWLKHALFFGCSCAGMTTPSYLG
jgi:hypothetical protein